MTLTRHLHRLLLCALALGLAAKPGYAQSTQLLLDGSLPNNRTDDITALQAGPNYEVSEDFGWRSGTNLFHSFALFDIGPSDSVTFSSNPMLPNLDRVIARVTGGEISDIDGRLASSIPTADLFLLNPAGILFGGASQIDVQRSLYVSTAHRLDFSNAMASLDLLDASNPTLSVEAPEAFGFYDTGPRSVITFFNPAGPAVAKTLRVPDGQTLSVVSGDINIQNRTLIQAFSGRAQLVAAGNADATVPIDASQFVARDVANLGQILIEARSSVDTLPFDPNAAQGTVVIRAGQLVMRDRALVQAGDRSATHGASVDVETGESITIDDRSELRAVSQGVRPTGNIRVSTASLSVSRTSLIRSRSLSFAPTNAVAGDVVIEAGSVRLDTSSSLVALNQGPGTGGGVSVAAATVDLDEASVLVSTTGTGSAGAIDIDATRITAINSVIAADGSTLADAGAVVLSADEIELRGGRNQVRTSRPLAAPPGLPASPGSSVTLAAAGGTVRILDGASISTQSSGPNRGGDISVDAESLEILDGGMDGGGDVQASALEAGTTGDGQGGNVSIVVGALRLGRSQGGDRAGRLATAVGPLATGAGGSIDIAADSIVLDGGGQISATTSGNGDAGAITLTTTGDVVITGDNVVDAELQPSGVFARAETDASGNDITINARSIQVGDGAEISTRALGAGESGNVSLVASETVRVAGAGEQGSVVTARGTNGQGGNVTIGADRLEVLDGGSVDVSTSGTGIGGQLVVDASDVIVKGFGPTPNGGGNALRASLAAQADATGNAAGIEIRATNRVFVGKGGQISALSRGLGGSPGDIDVSAPDIEIKSGLITAESGAGGGGNITLRGARSVVLGENAKLTVRSISGGDAGQIEIDTQSFRSNDSTIVADADAFGGNIEIRARDILALRNTEIVAISRGAGGGALAGGNIVLTGGAVAFDHSSVTADGFLNANGGNITISADPFVSDTQSRLSASSELGIDGTVEINAPSAQVSGEISQLPLNFLDASAQLQEACLAREAPAGTFAVRRDRYVAAPDALFVAAPPWVAGDAACEEP